MADTPRCHLCNTSVADAAILLVRINPKGEDAIWECRPACGARLEQSALFDLALTIKESDNG